jgi:hypothetical protein
MGTVNARTRNTELAESAKQYEVNKRPLARLQNPESQTRYASYMVRFVCHILRIVTDEEARLAQRSGIE